MMVVVPLMRFVRGEGAGRQSQRFVWWGLSVYVVISNK